MSRVQIDELMGSLWAAYKDCVATAAGLSNEQLDAQVPSFGGRQTALRNMLYSMVYQSLEHTIHVTKILQETGAPGASPSEVQLILSEAARALGTFTGLFARITDEDLGRSFENQTPQAVAEHVRGVVQNAQDRARVAIEGGTPATSP